MKNKIEQIFIEKKKQVLVDTVIAYKDYGNNLKSVLAMQVGLEPLGFVFSQEAIIQLSHLSDTELLKKWKILEPTLSSLVGSNKKFKPMYPNFPEQVFEANDYELLVNALMHYAGDWLGVRILPNYSEQVRLPLLENNKPKIIDVVGLDAVDKFFVSLVTSNVSVSASDKENIKDLFDYLNAKDKNKLISLLKGLNLSNKENLANLGGMVLKSDVDFNETLLDKFATPTDYLRLMAAYFDGDTSLATPTRVGKLNRPMRRALLGNLEAIMNSTKDSEQFIENMFSYREQWVKLAHSLHVGEYAKLFPMISVVFDDLRKNNKPKSFNFMVENLLSAGDVDSSLSFLVQRPGILARNIARLYSISKDEDNKKAIVYKFEKVASKVSTPVLLQLHAHFKYFEKSDVRSFMPKGGLSSLYVSDEKKNPIEKSFRESIVKICEFSLKERFAKLPALGSSYLDESLKKQNIPFAQRSASKALNTVARGSRFDIGDEKDTVRLFLWWNETVKENNKVVKNVGRVDIDLSCVMMNENFEIVRVCSYWDLRDANGAFAHSGDITSAPNGACEFIDVNLSKLDSGVHYIGMTINSFTQQKYSELPECFAGWMLREKPQSGNVFDARTVQNKIDITNESKQMIPAILDVKNRELIWADMSVSSKDLYVNNVRTNASSLTYNIKGIATMVRPNLYDLFEMHIEARGVKAKVKDNAKTVFSLSEGVTPYMFDKISSEFMADVVDEPILDNKKKNKI